MLVTADSSEAEQLRTEKEGASFSLIPLSPSEASTLLKQPGQGATDVPDLLLDCLPVIENVHKMVELADSIGEKVERQSRSELSAEEQHKFNSLSAQDALLMSKVYAHHVTTATTESGRRICDRVVLASDILAITGLQKVFQSEDVLVDDAWLDADPEPTLSNMRDALNRLGGVVRFDP
jgi:hypothetical protein